MADNASVLRESLYAVRRDRTSLSPASLRTLDALNGRRLSPSPSPGPTGTGSSHVVDKNDVSVTSSSRHRETDDRVIRHTRVQADYLHHSSDTTSNELFSHVTVSRTLTGTHGDVTNSGYDVNQSNRTRIMHEAHIRELEDELNNEKMARSKAEKQRSDLKAEISIINERLEAAVSANQLQVETTRKRETDLQKLQREIDELHAQHDVQLGSYRKKHQEAISQLTDQIDRLHSNRQKADREKIQLRVEVEEIGQQLEQLSKAKVTAEKCSRQHEVELSEVNGKMSEIQRELRDVTSQRTRLQQELNDVTPRVVELENQLITANKAKLALSKQLDELHRSDDSDSTARTRLANENRSLQQLVEQLQEQINEDHDLRVEIQRQVTKAQSEASTWRQKYEMSDQAVSPDIEDIKKKLSLRLTDCESRLGSAQAKINALEKINSKLQQETEALVAELDKYQNTNMQQDKRLRHSDKLMEDWQLKMNELTTKLDMSQIEARQHLADLNQSKEHLDESRDHINSLKRDNKTLTDEVRDLKDQLCQSKQTINDLEKTSQRFEAERDSLQGTVEAMESSLQQKEVKIERALLDIVSIKHEMEKRLSDKDEELQSVRKIHQRALDTIQTTLDTEARSRMEAVLVKKRLEQDISELELTLDSVNRARSEAEKNCKQCQQDLSDLEELLDEEQRSKRTNREELTLLERKNAALTNELQEMRTQLEVHEKTRKIVEEELRQTCDRVSELTALNTSLALNKKKLETDVHHLTTELEERMNEWKQASEQTKKTMNDVTRLSEELRQQEQSSVQTEKERRMFEFQTKELQTRLEDLETHSVHGSQKTIEKLEHRVHELETELANEQRRHSETQKSLRRHERRLVELTEQCDMDVKSKEREQDLIDKLQQKMKQYKRQLDEAESMASVNLAKYRKLQHDLEEAETRARLAEKSLSQHRALSRSTASVEETVMQPQSGVTVKKTTTRMQVVSSESRSEQQTTDVQRVTSSSSAGSRTHLALEKE